MLVTIMLCYMEIGSKITASGGSYIYVETAFGPFAGFIVNWLFFFGWGILGSAALMNVLADSLALLIPAFSSRLMHALIYFILLGTMALDKCARRKGERQAAGVYNNYKAYPASWDYHFRFQSC